MNKSWLYLPAFLVISGCQLNNLNYPVIYQDTKGYFGGNGVNIQPSYYNNGAVNFGWDLMLFYTNIKLVRLEIDPVGSDIKAATVESWISGALNNGYKVIATYHNDQAILSNANTNDLSTLIAAADWWAGNYSNLSPAGDFTINLMNEWSDHNITASFYAQSYNSAISIVRTVYSGPIIIDCPGWAQETHTAALASQLITDTNIIFSIHVYPDSWNGSLNHFMDDSDLDELASTGRPCISGT